MDAVDSIVRRSARDGWKCVLILISGAILELEKGIWSADNAIDSNGRVNRENAIGSWVRMLAVVEDWSNSGVGKGVAYFLFGSIFNLSQ